MARQLLDRFTAVDSSGTSYVIEEWQEVITHRNSMGFGASGGFSDLRTVEGHAVNPVDPANGEFEIIGVFGTIKVKRV